MRRWIGFALLMLACLVAVARADWPAGGKYIMGAENGTYSIRYVALHPQPSGDFHVLACGSGGAGIGLSVQLVSAGGDIAPGWPANGAGLGTMSASLDPYVNGFAVDDSACFWHARYASTTTSGIKAHMVRPNAQMLPTFGYWDVTSSGAGPAKAAAGIAGDAYILSGGNRLKRFTRAGTPVATWPVNGVSYGTGSTGDLGLIPDGSGGVLWFNAYGPTGFPSALRIASNASPAAGWTSVGIALSDDPADANSDLFTAALLRPLVRSGADHAFAAWTGPHNSSL